MSEFKIKIYQGQKIEGDVIVTLKIDGVRLHVVDGQYLSRAGKPLYNLPPDLEDGVYEIFRKNFKTTIGVVRSSVTPQCPITRREVFRLDKIDTRLISSETNNLTPELVKHLFDKAVKAGFEGLVIWKFETNQRWKVKTIYTEDVEVLEIVPGKGKHVGRMGALLTKIGKIGTGFTDAERELYNDKKTIVGKIIEVKGMEKTESGKMRHPVFVRLREDKK